MSCVVTSGYAIECRDSVGGVEVVYLIENSALYDASGNSRITSASGVVTALTKDSGKRFWKFEVPRATASANNGITSSIENGTFFYTHQVIFPINSRSADVRNIVTTLAKNRLTFILKEGDGSFRCYGAEFGLQLEASEAGTGQNLADRNGYLLTFSSQEREDFLIVPANIAATLETPGT
jgi:outer membrane protein assembly factor BamB